MSPELEAKVRSELSDSYHQYKESVFGADLKYHWKSDCPTMSRLTSKRPPTSPLSFISTMKYCNKSTIFYIAPSAQEEGRCSALNFPCIYKAWYRYHGNKPDKNFGRFCAVPVQITANGPQTIGEILVAHSDICERINTVLLSVKSGKSEQSGDFWSMPACNPHYFHLLPLCRAMIVLQDEYVRPPPRKIGENLSLDAQMQRQTAVLILTGNDSELSSPINFEALKHCALPLARDDFIFDHEAPMIRVPLKAAVEFIAEMQKREDLATSLTMQDSMTMFSLPKSDGYFTGISNAEEYVDNILDHSLESEDKRLKIKFALDSIEERERGEIYSQPEYHHWSPRWV